MKNLTEEELEELCRKHNIDTDIVKEFITKTGAYPFLLGEPSGYLRDFLTKEKNIIYDLGIIRASKEYQLKGIFIEFFGSKGITCDQCSKKKFDYVSIINKEGNIKNLCFKCFLYTYYTGINMDDNLEQFDTFIKNHNTNKSAVSLTMILFLTGLFDEKIKNIKEISDLQKIINDAASGRIITFNNNKLLQGLLLIYTGREIYPTSGDIINFSNIILGKSDISSESDTCSRLISIIEKQTKSNTKEKLGDPIEPWLIEQKKNIMTKGYVIGINRETEKAIHCSYTLLDRNRPENDWIPKSQINKSVTNFSIHIIKNTLEEIFGV